MDQLSLNTKLQKTFAIGCFHFGLKKPYPDGMRGSDYVKELKKTLESITNINNINIDSDDLLHNAKIESSAKIAQISEGENFFPPPGYFLEIEFDVFIPQRIQEELLDSIFLCHKMETENFRIHIKDSYHFPITFIELENVSDDDPSTAVVVIREFLNKKFKEKDFEYISFNCLGPSPFHADFYLREADHAPEKELHETNAFNVIYVPQEAYDTYYFDYANTLFSSAEDAAQFLFQKLTSELGLFYEIVHSQLLQNNAWMEIELATDSLIETNKKKRIKGVWSKVFGLYKKIQELIVLLSEFESEIIWSSYYFENHYKKLFQTGNKVVFISDLDNQMNQFPDYPTKQVRDIIDLLENRRSKTADNFIVLLAAIIGSVIGAIVTLGFTTL